MNRRELLLPTIALAGILNVFNSDSIYSSLYFYTHPAWKIYATILIPVALVFLVALAVSALIGVKRTVNILDLVTFTVLTLLVYNICKRNELLEGNLPLLVKASLAITVLALSCIAALLMPPYLLSRLRVAALAGCVFFLFAPEILSPIETDENVALLPFFQKDTGSRGPNIVILLLDELSNLKQSPIETALDPGVRQVYSKAVTSSGSHTGSSIPGLLTGVDMEGARACAPASMCSEHGMFNFAAQSVHRPRVNIVGFYHPYCEIHGLVYCRQIAVFGPASIIAGFGCDLFKQFAGELRPAFCERQWLNSLRATQAREQIRTAIFAAPFWKQGGTFYIHTLLPHPPASDAGTLDQDYAQNLEQAARLVREIVGRLDKSFGKNYLLVVTSDHPLRRNVWCKMYRYASADCLADPRFTSTEVPLIATGMGAAAVMNVRNNFELFNTLQAQ